MNLTDILNEVKVSNNTISRVVLSDDQYAGDKFGALGTAYKIILLDGSEIDTDDDDLLGRYEILRSGNRKSLEDLNKLLRGKQWDREY